MPLDPMTLSMLVGLGGQAISKIGDLLPSDLEKKNRKRLESLNRLEEMNALGLTGQERSVLEGRLSSKADASSAKADLERQRLLAGGGGAQPGQALLQAQNAEALKNQQLTQISQAIEEQDIKKRLSQEEELRALEAADAQVKQKRVGAIGSIGASGLEAGLGSLAQQKLLSPDNVAATAKTYGISDDQAKAFLEAQSANPDIAEQMNAFFISRNKLRNTGTK